MSTVYNQKPTYTVWTDGAKIFVQEGTRGAIVHDGDDATTEINWALSNLTLGRDYMQRVVAKGDFTTSAPIQIASHTHFSIDGKITLADNINDNIIENANRATYDYNVIIEGGILDGNKDNQTSGNGIDWYHDTVPVAAVRLPIVIRNMILRQVDDDALHFDAGSGDYISAVRIYNLIARTPDAYALYAVRVSDSHIYSFRGESSRAADNQMAVLIATGGNLECHDWYINHGIEVIGYFLLQLSHAFIDCTHTASDSTHGLALGGSRYGRFADLDIRILGSVADVSKNGIILQDGAGYHSFNNRFCNIHAGRFEGVGTNRWNYAIEEADADQDHNLYCNIDGLDSVTGALGLLGSHSQWTNIMGNVVI